MIIVITREADSHGAHMINLLKSRGENVMRLDYSRFPAVAEAGFSISGSGASLRISDELTVQGERVKSVLNRRQAEPLPPQGLQGPAGEYVVRESRAFLDALPQLIDSFWLSDPDMVRIANRKPYQLRVAKRLGFVIPRTIVTNSPDEAREFFNGLATDMAAKPLLSPGVKLEEDKIISLYTQRIPKNSETIEFQSVKNCPLIFQEYKEKAFELRITVVCGQAFACAIHSQKSEKTKHDWRRYDLTNTPHEIFELPDEVREKCVKLVEELGLSFGCIDMIVTPEGEYVFLEINPNGQWLWIERLTKMPISDAIADVLINPPKL